MKLKWVATKEKNIKKIDEELEWFYIYAQHCRMVTREVGSFDDFDLFIIQSVNFLIIQINTQC